MGRVLRGQAWTEKHQKKRKKGDAWQDYLKGEYSITNKGQLDKMHFDIRRIAKKRMKDLLLICTSQVLPERQRILIFRDIRNNSKLWSETVQPLVRELMNNACIPPPGEFEKTQRLARGLELAQIKYDLVRLLTVKTYRDEKEVELESKGYHTEPQAYETEAET